MKKAKPSSAVFSLGAGASQKMLEASASEPGSVVWLKGLTGSAQALVLADLFTATGKSIMCVLPDKDEAAYFHSDLLSFLEEKDVLFFPSSWKRRLLPGNLDESGVVLRTSVLDRMSESKTPLVLVTYSEALAESVVALSTLKDQTFLVKTGDQLSQSFMREVFEEYGFVRADFVGAPGQYSLRGSIIDVFSYSARYPYRLDFEGNNVSSLRTFNLETQLSIEILDHITIIPDFRKSAADSELSFITQYFKEKPLCYLKDAKLLNQQTEQFFGTADKGREIFSYPLQIANPETMHSVMVTGFESPFPAGTEIIFRTVPQPAFSKNFDLLGTDLIDLNQQKYKVFILGSNAQQLERIATIYNDMGMPGLFTSVTVPIHEGFIDHERKAAFYTDHQIFGRHHKYRLREDFVKSESLTLNELTDLHPGDFVVHIDHGIGVFGGLEPVDIGGKMQERIRIVFRDKDILYLNLHSLHKIARYRGKDSESPRLNKLGTGAWQSLKQKTKSKVKDIARDLIALYAARMKKEGFAYSSDSYMQHELEASFIYEDTPDQEKATVAVKLDMEKPVPMDRLICGDVGFGKTEIAIRAAFKAVSDSKQVAVLVPTTILALQHYYTFRDRLNGFPCKIEFVSRLKPMPEQKKILKELEAGKVDILIGTHRLLSKEIKFKDLGLLIIDEEQKFGVAAKEKLRAIRINVDTLTLTATPIPRTLQFSLLGARDLSIINTPPPNRHPVETTLIPMNDEILRDAILFEVNRGGQVFFVHNRIQNIPEIEDFVHRLCPTVRTEIGHGQMDPGKLEDIMLRFIEGDFDVLISTTIIENGLDIPNANTIIINDAHNYGLSDLHQLRGRVGRSNRKAFCYLITPPQDVLSQDARRRLKAIEDFSELGSGFNIALQDLDIRGAGNMLGAEQSGFIADIGFETYQRILEEAVHELREEEFPLAETGEIQKVPEFRHECQVETDLELLLPEEYVPSVPERIRLYRELDIVEDDDQLEKFRLMLNDRFGSLPEQATGLLEAVKLRRLARLSGFEKVALRKGAMVCYFISDREASFYKSGLFSKMLQYLQEKRMASSLKEQKDKLQLSVPNIHGIRQAITWFEKLRQELGIE